MKWSLNAAAIDALAEPELRKLLKATTAALAVMLERQHGENGIARVVLERAGEETVEIETVNAGGMPGLSFRLVREPAREGSEPPGLD